MGRQQETGDTGKRVLIKIRKIKPFLEGSLTTTRRRCGNPNCRCAQEGSIHEITLLTWKEEQKTRTFYVPKYLREEVAKWLEEMKKLRRLIHEMSEAQRQFLVTRKWKKGRDR